MASNIRTALGYTPDGFSIVKRHDEHYNGNARLGDLFMVKFCSSSGGSGLQLYHAGVCCREGYVEIIHFRPSSQSRSSGSIESTNSSSCSGDICKSSVNGFCKQNTFTILRKDRGIPKSFQDNVEKAMERTPDYNLFTYNCIHFAMELLDVDSETTEDYIEKLLKIVPHNMKMLLFTS